jgi:BlaI family penicillinase repressor
MGRLPVTNLGPLQLRIMKVLWDRSEATVADVNNALKKENLAYTTMATMLRKMDERGLVSHRKEGRTFVYRAEIEKEKISDSIAGEMLDRLFSGSVADMVSHLLSNHEVDADELRRIEKLVKERKKSK